MKTTFPGEKISESDVDRVRDGMDKETLMRRAYAVLWGVHKQMGSVVSHPVGLLQRSLHLGYSEDCALLQELSDQGVVRRQGPLEVRVFYRHDRIDP